jgi:peptidase inhibitor family I36
MVRPLASRSLTRRLLPGLTAALIVAAVAAPASGSARPFAPDCRGGQVCFYENANWNKLHGPLTKSDGGQSLHRAVTTPVQNVLLGGRLADTVSSYANFSGRLLCVHDGNPRDKHTRLWTMFPHGSSSWIGSKQVNGETVNDKADYYGPC